ncbi:MAG: type II toxin-antitoxin system VapC family toxin, partial [Deltaproteobacteria bacterium]|nr:type II toxin-antitoxin system VapC family toxin [Deltaproteobacteria bacterium]
MKLQIYLDTSVISAAFDERNPERKALTEEFFAQANKFDVYVSEITLVEIEKTTLEDLREKMKTLVKPFSVLEISDDVQGLT